MTDFKAELVRITTDEVDIKINNGSDMHVLQWRRRLLHDKVMVNGKLAGISRGLWGREKVYGLVFGRDEAGDGGVRMMLLLDPRNSDRWASMGDSINGVRLETAEGTLLAHGSLDPKNIEKPSTFADWMRKQMGIEW